MKVIKKVKFLYIRLLFVTFASNNKNIEYIITKLKI